MPKIGDPAKKFTAVGAYIFAGGFTTGVKAAGFDVLCHLEDGDFGVKSTLANYPNLSVHVTPDEWPLEDLEDVDFVYANPPCSVFSVAGYSPKYATQSDKWRTDPLTGCLRRSIMLLGALSPRVLAVESVQLALTRGKDLMWTMADEAISLGYGVDFVKLDGACVGLPQRRRRMFMVASRVEIRYPYDRDRVKTTVRDAIGDLDDDGRELPNMSAFYDRSLRYTKPGMSLISGFNKSLKGKPPELNTRGQVKGRPAFVYMRLAWDDVSSTLLGGPRYFHPEEHRHVSVREFQVLCGYPSDYKFVGGIDHKYAQIAKAVTPTVGRWLAGCVRRALARSRSAKVKVRLVDLERGVVKELRSGDVIK